MAFARDSFIQSGAGTMFVDFAFADYEKSWVSLPSMVAGPAISGLGNDFASLISLALRTDWTEENERTKYIRKTLVNLEKNSPSLLFTKAALNKNIFDSLHAVMNTGRKPSNRQNFFSLGLDQ